MGVNPQTPGIYRIEDQSMKKYRRFGFILFH